MIRQIAFATTAAATLAIAFAAPAFAQTMPTAPDHQMTHPMTETDSPLLSFSITEEVKSTPDRASISAGVTTQAPTAVEAMRQNSEAIASMIAALRRAGIENRDIQTNGFNLSPQYDYRPQEQGRPPILTGYQVSNQLTVTTANVTRIGALIDSLVSAGGTNISGPNFFVADSDAQLEEARDTAMRKASERAMRYARAAGYARARLVAITEGGGFMPTPMPVMARMSADSAAGNAIQPGQVSNGLTISVQYRLER